MTTINPVQTPVAQAPAFKGRKELYKGIKNISKKESISMDVLDKLTLSNPIDRAIVQSRPKEEINEHVVIRELSSLKLDSKCVKILEKLKSLMNKDK